MVLDEYRVIFDQNPVGCGNTVNLEEIPVADAVERKLGSAGVTFAGPVS